MLDKVLFHGGDLAPTTPSDEELAALTDKAYSEALDNWTVTAQAAPYVGPEY